MRIINVGSGSKGNCTFIQTNETTLMIDCGIGITRIRQAIRAYGINNIDALLLTHQHSDHIKSLKYFDSIPSYSLDGSIARHCLQQYESIAINSIGITVFPLSHDAPNTCGYFFNDGKNQCIYVTDTGYVPSSVIDLGRNSDYIIMECNHDIDMLMSTNRPYYLKARILGDDGHLNNEDGAKAISCMVGNKTKEVFIAHISQQANDPLLAFQAVSQQLEQINYQGKINVLSQDKCVVGGNL